MELARDETRANVIRAWEPGRVRIGEQWIFGNLIVSRDRIVPDWDIGDPRAISVADLDAAIALQPEIIVLGTGTDAALPDVELMAALARQTIGIEIMTTPSACRTFNVLAHEERRVVAALFNTAE